MPVAKSDSFPLEPLLHPPACDACGDPLRYGVEIEADWTDEPEIRGFRCHVRCWVLASRGLRAARAVAAFAAWAVEA